MKIQAKIASVQDDLESWQDFYIVVGHFEDGSKFKAWGKDKDKANRTRNELAGMVGQPGEFDIDETKTKEYKGVKELRLKGWPGKPERPAWSGGGGGKAPYQPRYRDTPEGFAQEQRSIHRSVALEWSVESFSKDQPLALILDRAEAYYGFLSKDAPQAPIQPPAASSVRPEPSTGSYDPLKEQKEFFGASLTTGDKVKSPTVQKYLAEIEAAVKIKDADRIAKLSAMVNQSLDRKTLTLADIDQWINPAIIAARQAISSSAEVEQW